MSRLVKERNSEICNLCGRSVAPGSGWFVNRVPDLNTVAERREMGRPYPGGNWLCAGCEEFCPLCETDYSMHHKVLRRIRKNQGRKEDHTTSP